MGDHKVLGRDTRQYCVRCPVKGAFNNQGSQSYLPLETSKYTAYESAIVATREETPSGFSLPATIRLAWLADPRFCRHIACFACGSS